MRYVKRNLKYLLLACAICLAVAFRWADEDFTQLISEKLQKYRMHFPQEKAYLHLDKPYYSAGDTIFFKGYLVESSLHLADSASNVLYVDLIDQQSGKNVALRRVQMLGGVGNGEIVLADSLGKGAYSIRAYTNWMRNFPEDFFFAKNIYVFDPDNTTPPDSSTALSVQFFPEGGQLVAGINTRIAFKAIDGNGFGKDVSGFVIDKNKDTVASFRSEHLGMGRFQFRPVEDMGYQAFVSRADGKPQPATFPEVKPSGYTMMVDGLSNPLKMRVIAYCRTPDKKDNLVHVVGHSRGIISFVAKGNIGERGLLLNIPTTGLQDGITHLTLFDENKNPVCERLVFVDHARSLKVDVKPAKNTYKPREKTAVEVTVTDSAGKAVEANLSVAVTDAGQIAAQPYSQSIVSYLLLSSDLKGHIEQPSYYFDPEKSKRKIHMDYLMMTQGWTRFKWEEVLKDSLTAPAHFLEQGFTLEGEVKRNNREVNGKVMLSAYFSNDSLNTFLTAEADENGHFAIYNLVFPDSLKVRLQGMNKKGDQNLTFRLYPFEAPKVTLVKVPYFPVTVDEARLRDFIRRAQEEQEITRKIRESREKQLREVTIRAKKAEQRDARKLYSTADATLVVTQQMAAGNQSVLDMLAGRVAGVQVTGSGMNASVSIRGNRGEPLFVLDGMTVDKAMITSLNVYDVASIDVLKGPGAAIFGSRGGNGVISVLTKRGSDNYDYSQDIVPGVLVTRIAGFNVPKVFYTPDYEVTNTPDFRSTIYWAPMLKTDRNGKVKLEYPNTDSYGPVEIRAEVLSPEGTPGTGTVIYQIR